jgi:hypothetical protein
MNYTETLHRAQIVATEKLAMFCDACVDFCNNFDLDVAKSEGGILHYVNYGEIVASAHLRCGICIEIRRQRENKEPPGTYDDKYRAYGGQIRCLFDEHNMGLVWIQGDLEIPYIAYMDVCTTGVSGISMLLNVKSRTGATLSQTCLKCSSKLA